MTRALWKMAAAVAAACVFGGCATSYCDDICTYIIDCDVMFDQHELCVEDCLAAYDDGKERCRDATQSLAQCVGDRSCQKATYGCYFRYEAWDEECR